MLRQDLAHKSYSVKVVDLEVAADRSRSPNWPGASILTIIGRQSFAWKLNLGLQFPPGHLSTSFCLPCHSLDFRSV